MGSTLSPTSNTDTNEPFTVPSSAYNPEGMEVVDVNAETEKASPVVGPSGPNVVRVSVPKPKPVAAVRTDRVARRHETGAGAGRTLVALGTSRRAPLSSSITKPAPKPKPLLLAANPAPAPMTKPALGPIPLGLDDDERAPPAKVTEALLRHYGVDRSALCQASDLSEEEQMRRHTSFIERLLIGRSDIVNANGVYGPVGMMRWWNPVTNRPNVPLGHQRAPAKDLAKLTGSPNSCDALILGHEMGLGKTITMILAWLAYFCRLGRIPKALFSVPSAVVDQFEDSIAQWTTLDMRKVLIAREGAQLTHENILNADIILTTTGIIASAFSKCYSNQALERDPDVAPGGKRKAWQRTPGTAVHPLYDPPSSRAHGWYGIYDMVFFDEVHRFCDEKTIRHNAHKVLSRDLAVKRCGASGTWCANRPGDLSAEAAVLDIPEANGVDFQDKKTFTVNGCTNRINRDAVELFKECAVDIATNEEVDLPPLARESKNVNVEFTQEQAVEFNEILSRAQRIRQQIIADAARRGTGPSAVELQALMSEISSGEQYVLSPTVGRYSAARVAKTESLWEMALKEPTAQWYALRDTLRELHREGHRQIVVCSTHVTCLKLVKQWIGDNCPDLGRLFLYEGSEMDAVERVTTKRAFLGCPKGVLFLSMHAGAVGLQLAPGPEAIVFWGGMSFTPANVDQALARIWRIGQFAPRTGQVTALHLISHGSFGAAIAKLHADKARMIALVQRSDTSGFADEDDDRWRKYNRIASEVVPVNVATGNFPEMPQYAIDPSTGEPAVPHRPFTLLVNTTTRGRAPRVALKREKRKRDDTQIVRQTHRKGSSSQQQPPPPPPERRRTTAQSIVDALLSPQMLQP